MTFYTLFVAFALTVIVLLTWASIREERARRELGAHFDQAVAVGNAEEGR